MSLIAWLIRWSCPFVWRLPGGAARKLAEFAEAEQGSMIELRQAAARTPSHRVRALYLTHALDEARHSTMFARASAERRERDGKLAFDPPRGEITEMHEHMGELAFLAAVYRSEKRGRVQFEVYEKYFARTHDERLAALFRTILTDERRHESYSHALLLEIAGSPEKARSAIRLANARAAFATFRRVGRGMGERMYFVAMIVLFVLASPLSIYLRLVRPIRAGWRAEAKR